METVIMQSGSKDNLNLLLKLADKLGIKFRVVKEELLEDLFLSEAISEGMKTEDVPKSDIMRTLKNENKL
ncbi:MAG: hypothetical protein NTU44_05010 [Bacteroidetes bacterium]|nr:hypothetical protein [Bacteroidota bacterium]